jgi:hypothetical protein
MQSGADLFAIRPPFAALLSAPHPAALAATFPGFAGEEFRWSQIPSSLSPASFRLSAHSRARALAS